MLTVWFFVYKKLAQFAVRGALPPRRSESPGYAADNKPSCALHLLGSCIGSRGFSSLEQKPEFWVLQTNHTTFWGCQSRPLRWPKLCLWSAFLSKKIHFLAITLSLTEFFLWRDIKNLNFIRSSNQVPWVLAGFESQPCGLEAQAGFWLGLGPRHMG